MFNFILICLDLNNYSYICVNNSIMNKLESFFKLRISGKDKTEIKEKAKKLNISGSEYIRQALNVVKDEKETGKRFGNEIKKAMTGKNIPEEAVTVPEDAITVPEALAQFESMLQTIDIDNELKSKIYNVFRESISPKKK